jgi:hypothetical protein
MNTENFDNKVNALLKKYIFSEDMSSPEVNKIAEKIKETRRQALNDPKKAANDKAKIAAMLNGEDGDDKKNTPANQKPAI